MGKEGMHNSRRIDLRYLKDLRCVDCESYRGYMSFYAVFWNSLMIKEPIPLCSKCAREFIKFVDKNSNGKYKVLDIGMIN
ncbi:MAG: hypothetical protein QXW14_03705 [Candidatus Nitrosocaldus sp.]